MSWIFTPISIPTTATKENPTRVVMKGIIGQVGGLVVILPISTNQHQVGVRIKTPEGPLLPVVIEGSDRWIYSQKYGVKLELREHRSLGKSAPINIIVEGFNTDAATQIAQIGIYVHPWANDTQRIVGRIITTLDVISSAAVWPEIERQIRRVFTLARDFFTGGKNE